MYKRQDLGRKYLGESTLTQIISATSAACDARMDGAPVTAVSYTHLDVYKRQGEASAFFSPSGEQLTDYRVGPFKWSWSKGEI